MSIIILYTINMLINLSININKFYWQDIMSFQSNTLRTGDIQGNFQQTSSRVVSSRYSFVYLAHQASEEIWEKTLLNPDFNMRTYLENKFSSPACPIFQISEIWKIFCFLCKVNGSKTETNSFWVEIKRTNSTKDYSF